MQWSLRYLPLLFALGFTGILLGLRGMTFRRQFGYSPFRFPSRDDVSAGAFLSRMLVACLTLIVLSGIVMALAPDWLDRWDPLYGFRGSAMLIAGAGLMMIGLAIVWQSQRDMADSWRVGIDPTERTKLVTRGLFRFCRNPIYFGLQVGLVGFMGMAPTCFTLTILAMSLVLFQVQARLEEAHLVAQHGESYLQYGRRVGRFLPWTGRFANPADNQPNSEKS